MRIDWSQRVGGTEPLEIRNLIARATSKGREPLDLDGIATALAGFKSGSHRYVFREDKSLQMSRAEHLLGIMAASGLIRIAKIAYSKEATEHDYSFSLTSTGRGLYAADKRKRMSRTQADKLVEQVLEAARNINADPSQHFDIAQLSLYGSYLSDTPDLGDLDVAFEMKRRQFPEEKDTLDGRDTPRRARARRFEAKHPAPASQSIRHLAWYNYSWDRIVPLRMLRVSRLVSLTEMYRLDSLGCASMEIYPNRIASPAKPGWVPPTPYRGLIDDGGVALAALRAETARLIQTDPAYRMGSGTRHDPFDE